MAGETLANYNSGGMPADRIRGRTRRLTLLAMLLAMGVVLTALEHMLPPLPLVPPNVRLGLSNIITMYTLFFLGRREAAVLAVLKAGFVLLMRGATAGLLSLCGGLLSVGAMMLPAALFRDASYMLLSVFGAIAHNVGQILAASALLRTSSLFYTLPLLTAFGVLCGVLTGTLLRVVMPIFDKTLGKSGRNP